mmetsp:Transcript_24470/g.28503  ORF Transcript_24470/g.28503 Transcript_24470/m.28503 type:complete len:96 (+) Transcript_24470:1-288(+)
MEEEAEEDGVASVVLPVAAAVVSLCDALPTDCVICEIDAVDVHLCHCGNWLHRECAFDWDGCNTLQEEDEGKKKQQQKDAEQQPLLKCCSLCGRR